MNDERLLRPREVADFLGVPLATLYQWRSRGGGPRAIRVGKHLRYRSCDVDTYLDAHADDRAGGDAA